MDINAFIEDVVSYRREHPSQRIGQAHFNVLYQAAPEIANEIRGTEDDPFYNDQRLGAFFARVTEKETAQHE